MSFAGVSSKMLTCPAANTMRERYPAPNDQCDAKITRIGETSVVSDGKLSIRWSIFTFRSENPAYRAPWPMTRPAMNI